MSIVKRAELAFLAEPFTAADQEKTSQPFDCREVDQFMLLINVEEDGTVDHGATLTITPVFYDDNMVPYVNPNTTWGTFSVAGSAVPTKFAVNGPALANTMALKVKAGGTLTSADCFKLSARIVLMTNTGG